nr:Snf5 [Coprinopsis cinerea]
MNPAQQHQKFAPGGLRNAGLPQIQQQQPGQGQGQQQQQQLTPQQRQLMIQKMQQQQQLGMMERPPSSMSISAPQPQGAGGMMPPPPPRPSTAMGGQVNPNAFPSASRPGTSMSHRSPAIDQQGPSQQEIAQQRQLINQQIQAQLTAAGLTVRDLTPQQHQNVQQQIQTGMQDFYRKWQQQRMAQMQQQLLHQQQQQQAGQPRPGSRMGIHQSPPPTPQDPNASTSHQPQPQQGGAGSPTAPGTPTQAPSSPSFLRGAKRKLDSDGTNPSPSPGLMNPQQQQQMNGQQQQQLNALQQQQLAAMRQRQTASPRPDGMGMNMGMMGGMGNMAGMNNMGMGGGGGTVNPMMLDGFGGGNANNMGMGTVNPAMLSSPSQSNQQTPQPQGQGQQGNQQQQQQRQRQPSMPMSTPIPAAPSISASSSSTSVGGGNMGMNMGGNAMPGTPQRQSSLPPPGTPTLGGTNLMSNSPLGAAGMGNMGMGNVGSNMGMGGGMNHMDMNAMGLNSMGMNNLNAMNNMGGLNSMNNMGMNPQMNNLAGMNPMSPMPNQMNMSNMGGMGNMGMNNMGNMGGMNANALNAMGGNNMGIKPGMVSGGVGLPNMPNQGNMQAMPGQQGQQVAPRPQGPQGMQPGMGLGGIAPSLSAGSSTSGLDGLVGTPSNSGGLMAGGLGNMGMGGGNIMGGGANTMGNNANLNMNNLALGNNIVSGGLPGTPPIPSGGVGGGNVGLNAMPNMGLNAVVGGGTPTMTPGVLGGGPAGSPIVGQTPVPASTATPPIVAPVNSTGLPIPPAPPSVASSSGTVPPTAPIGPAGMHQQVIPQLPPLPTSVNLNPNITRVTPVPLQSSLTLIPPLSQEDITNIQEWMAKDKNYEEVILRKAKERMTEEIRDVFGSHNPAMHMGMRVGKNQGWWEKGFAMSIRGLKPLYDPEACPKDEDVVAAIKEEEEKAKASTNEEGGSAKPSDDANAQQQQQKPDIKPPMTTSLRQLPYTKEWFWSSQSRYRKLPVFNNIRGGGWTYINAEPFDVRYPPRPGRTQHTSRAGKKGIKREGLKIPRRLPPEEANKPEQLIPIRLEFDVEHHRMRDTFVWNMNDPVVTPEHFAQSLVEDYGLPPSYHGVISKSIHDQINDFKAHSFLFDGGVVSGDGDTSTELVRVKPVKADNDDDKDVIIRGKLDKESAEWWRNWRRKVRMMREGRTSSRKKAGKRRKVEGGVRVKKEKNGDEADVEDESDLEEKEDVDEEGTGSEKEKAGVKVEDEVPLAIHEIPFDDNATHEEMRILIKLDIIVGSMKLDDQFEWDLESSEVTPEEFAEVYARDLGLGGEFKTAIAHSIREQIQTYQKSLFLVGHLTDGTVVQDEELRQSFLPSLVSGARTSSEVSQYTPTLNYLSDGEIERTEKERDKDLTKRRKRNTRGRRGVALPDREPIRTYRTPAIGFPELDPATMALAVANAAPTSSRRAAAAAASLTIANMVASENSNSNYSPPLMNAPLPSVTQTASSQSAAAAANANANANKEKKVKGFFKAPSFPSSVLKPRAQVVAPTPSTAVDVSSLPAPLENDPPSNQSNPQLEYRAKLQSIRRAKELEREAKAQEFIDGQRPNYVNGVWHCSNCGCPESIAVGRRKGPLGDKSQCGTCGKFWHRHRRPRPVEYNPDPEYHLNASSSKADHRPSGDGTPKPSSTINSKKKGAAAARAAALAASQPQTPGRGADSSPVKPMGMGMLVDDDDLGAMSPVSDASSDVEMPLVQQRAKVNGASSNAGKKSEKEREREQKEKEQREREANEKEQREKEREKEKEKEHEKEKEKEKKEKEKEKDAGSGAPPGSGTPGGRPPQQLWPPEWLTKCMHAMQNKYPNDKFDVILRKTSTNPEWRIKCLDCPGKLYTPGPGETLNNYEVHLKNRLHRQRVNERLSGNAPAAPQSANGNGGAAAGPSNSGSTSGSGDQTASASS